MRHIKKKQKKNTTNTRLLNGACACMGLCRHHHYVTRVRRMFLHNVLKEISRVNILIFHRTNRSWIESLRSAGEFVS